MAATFCSRYSTMSLRGLRQRDGADSTRPAARRVGSVARGSERRCSLHSVVRRVVGLCVPRRRRRVRVQLLRQPRPWGRAGAQLLLRRKRPFRGHCCHSKIDVLIVSFA
jgi:hypothetical protein